MTNNWSKLFMMVALVGVMSSCGLGVPERFEYIPEPVEVVVNDMTVYEYVTSNPENFTQLAAAIDRAGLQSMYEAADRTHFLTLDAAWTAGDGIIATLGGDGATSVDDIEVDRLTNLLMYHMLDEYVVQESFPKLDVDRVFQTLQTGDDGIMSIRRSSNKWELQINQAPEIEGTARKTNVNRHNYLFQDNVAAHLIFGYVQNTPF